MHTLSLSQVSRAVARLYGRYPLPELLKGAVAQMRARGQRIDTQQLAHSVARSLLHERGILLAQVTTAHPLSARQREELQEVLKQRTDADEVHFDEQVNPDHLGGLTVQTADMVLEASVTQPSLSLLLVGDSYRDGTRNTS